MSMTEDFTVDTGLIVSQLKARGHAVGGVISAPNNAGVFEFMVDGTPLTLEQVRDLISAEAPDRDLTFKDLNASADVLTDPCDTTT